MVKDVRRYVDINALPELRRRGRTSEWLELIKEIPEGKAWVVKEGDLSIKLATLKIVVHRLIRNKQLSSNYRVQQSTDSEGNETVYVIREKEDGKD